MGRGSRRSSPVAASPHFPALLDPGDGPCAFWPEGGSIAEFHDLAQRLGVLLVDAHATCLPDDVEALAARLGEVRPADEVAPPVGTSSDETISGAEGIRLGLVPEMLPAERRLAEDLSAYPSPVRRLLLDVLTTRDDADRARRIGELYADDRSRSFAECLIDLEEESAARALVVGTLREFERASEG